MGGSIQLANWCSSYTAGLANAFAAKSREEKLEREADRMLKKIREERRIKPRVLYRTYDRQRKELHQPVLEHLVRTGRARLIDGFVEAQTEFSTAARCN